MKSVIYMYIGEALYWRGLRQINKLQRGNIWIYVDRKIDRGTNIQKNR